MTEALAVGDKTSATTTAVQSMQHRGCSTTETPQLQPKPHSYNNLNPTLTTTTIPPPVLSCIYSGVSGCVCQWCCLTIALPDSSTMQFADANCNHPLSCIRSVSLALLHLQVSGQRDGARLLVTLPCMQWCVCLVCLWYCSS
jgi:hypothetical protein